ncbi:glycosyltransferase family 4 protein [Xylocopilactobacillus apicola]|uniref:Glycosyl transferase n=1 Tax=Xylocopilactobacillus apicola TaxID=2932184 RepID=A0AAU9DUQ4_9LACO|nr:glycosyltransferase family 4 protein [Xylocopilactobacillus apicola]BDR59243.1 glycosyl transferase [Xylocopilactobacillus apicola]
MKIANINAGQETGGALTHLIFQARVLKKHQVDNELILFTDSTVAKAARENGLKYQVVNQRKPEEWIKYLNEKRFDLVQTHGPRANFLVGLQQKKLFCPRVVTVHSDPRYDFLGGGLKGKIQTKLNLASLRRADGLFVVSTELKEELLKLKIPADKISQIINAIDFSAEVPAKIKHDFMQVIIVARLHPVKGHARLIKALAHLNNPHIFLHVVGAGDLKDELNNLVAENELTEQVQFYGALDQRAINELYCQMDLALIVSKSEGFPLVFLEAANNAVPVLMTELSVTSQLIPDADKGIVVNNSQEGIEKGLSQAYQMGVERLSQLGQNSRTYARDHFGAEQFFEDLMTGYEKFSKKEKL